MRWISKLCLYAFVAIIAYLVFLPAFMPIGLTPFTQEYHRGYQDELNVYSSVYNATCGNYLSFNIDSFRKWAYCVGYEDAWRSSEYETHKK
jgi:hypothetical protein